MFLFPYGVTKVDLVLEQVIISPNLSPVAEVPIIKSGCIIHSIFSYFTQEMKVRELKILRC